MTAFIFIHLSVNSNNLRIGTGLPNIQKRDLENFTILAPNLSIQRKNLALFEMLDEKISVLNEELTILEKQKKYLLCNMLAILAKW